MATNTTNYNLIKPATTDFYDVGDFNDNADIIDGLIAGIPRTNLLDNPWFTVNQRGQNSYSGNAYSVDRWKLSYTNSTPTLAVVQNGVNFTTSASGTSYLTQVRNDISQLLGKQITGSIMMQDGTIYSGTVTRTSGDQTLFNTAGLRMLVSDTNIYISSTSASTTFAIRAVKLEFGSVSTLAKDKMPDWGSELVKCYTSKADANDIYANKVVSFRPTYVTAIMASASWNTSTNTYSFESTYPVASYDISISVAPTALSTQYDAFSKAKICGSADSNVVKALGTRPTVDIPIIIKVVKK